MRLLVYRLSLPFSLSFPLTFLLFLFFSSLSLSLSIHLPWCFSFCSQFLPSGGPVRLANSNEYSPNALPTTIISHIIDTKNHRIGSAFCEYSLLFANRGGPASLALFSFIHLFYPPPFSSPNIYAHVRVIILSLFFSHLSIFPYSHAFSSSRFPVIHRFHFRAITQTSPFPTSFCSIFYTLPR